MLLTDIAVEHTLMSPQKVVRATFLLHPFTNTQRDTFGKFEIVRDIREPGFKEVKRSTFAPMATQSAPLMATQTAPP